VVVLESYYSTLGKDFHKKKKEEVEGVRYAYEYAYTVQYTPPHPSIHPPIRSEDRPQLAVAGCIIISRRSRRSTEEDRQTDRQARRLKVHSSSMTKSSSLNRHVSSTTTDVA